jgi:hypothetical protein
MPGKATCSSSRDRLSEELFRTYSVVVKFEFTIQPDNGTSGGIATVAVRLVNSVVKFTGKDVSSVSPNFSA